MSTPDGTLAARVLPNGRKVQIIPLTFNRARICLMEENELFYEDSW